MAISWENWSHSIERLRYSENTIELSSLLKIPSKEHVCSIRRRFRQTPSLRDDLLLPPPLASIKLLPSAMAPWWAGSGGWGHKRGSTERGLAAERRGGPEVQGGDGQERWGRGGGRIGGAALVAAAVAARRSGTGKLRALSLRAPSHADRRRSSSVPSTLRFRGGRLAGVLLWLSFPFHCFHGDRRMGKIKFQLLLQ